MKNKTRNTKEKSGKADTNIYTHILSIITVLKICLSLRAIETKGIHS